MSDPVFTADWFSQNIQALTEVLAKFKGQPNIHALEIGCFEGMGTLWMLNNVLTEPTCTIDCIDTFQGSAEHSHFGISFLTSREAFIENTKRSSKILCYPNRSDQVLPSLLGVPKRYDIIYVDGSHIASDVITDLVLSWPLLKKGGVMFMDDYEWPGIDKIEQHMPKIAIDTFTTIFIEQLKFLHKGYSVAVEKL